MVHGERNSGSTQAKAIAFVFLVCAAHIVSVANAQGPPSVLKSSNPLSTVNVLSENPVFYVLNNQLFSDTLATFQISETSVGVPVTFNVQQDPSNGIVGTTHNITITHGAVRVPYTKQFGGYVPQHHVDTISVCLSDNPASSLQAAQDAGQTTVNSLGPRAVHLFARNPGAIFTKARIEKQQARLSHERSLLSEGEDSGMSDLLLGVVGTVVVGALLCSAFCKSDNGNNADLTSLQSSVANLNQQTTNLMGNMTQWEGAVTTVAQDEQNQAVTINTQFALINSNQNATTQALQAENSARQLLAASVATSVNTLTTQVSQAFSQLATLNAQVSATVSADKATFMTIQQTLGNLSTALASVQSQAKTNSLSILTQIRAITKQVRSLTANLYTYVNQQSVRRALNGAIFSYIDQVEAQGLYTPYFDFAGTPPINPTLSSYTSYRYRALDTVTLTLASNNGLSGRFGTEQNTTIMCDMTYFLNNTYPWSTWMDLIESVGPAGCWVPTQGTNPNPNNVPNCNCWIAYTLSYCTTSVSLGLPSPAPSLYYSGLCGNNPVTVTYPGGSIVQTSPITQTTQAGLFTSASDYQNEYTAACNGYPAQINEFGAYSSVSVSTAAFMQYLLVPYNPSLCTINLFTEFNNSATQLTVVNAMYQLFTFSYQLLLSNLTELEAAFYGDMPDGVTYTVDYFVTDIQNSLPYPCWYANVALTQNTPVVPYYIYRAGVPYIDIAVQVDSGAALSTVVPLSAGQMTIGSLPNYRSEFVVFGELSELPSTRNIWNVPDTEISLGPHREGKVTYLATDGSTAEDNTLTHWKTNNGIRWDATEADNSIGIYNMSVSCTVPNGWPSGNAYAYSGPFCQCTGIDLFDGPWCVELNDWRIYELYLGDPEAFIFPGSLTAPSTIYEAQFFSVIFDQLVPSGQLQQLIFTSCPIVSKGLPDPATSSITFQLQNPNPLATTVQVTILQTVNPANFQCFSQNTYAIPASGTYIVEIPQCVDGSGNVIAMTMYVNDASGNLCSTTDGTVHASDLVLGLSTQQVNQQISTYTDPINAQLTAQVAALNGIIAGITALSNAISNQTGININTNLNINDLFANLTASLAASGKSIANESAAINSQTPVDYNAVTAVLNAQIESLINESFSDLVLQVANQVYYNQQVVNNSIALQILNETTHNLQVAQAGFADAMAQFNAAVQALQGQQTTSDNACSGFIDGIKCYIEGILSVIVEIIFWIAIIFLLAPLIVKFLPPLFFAYCRLLSSCIKGGDIENWGKKNTWGRNKKSPESEGYEEVGKKTDNIIVISAPAAASKSVNSRLLAMQSQQ